LKSKRYETISIVYLILSCVEAIMRTATIKTALILVLAILSTFSLSFGAKHLERSFQVSPGGTFTLNSDFGGVKVVGRGGNTVLVQVDSDRDIEDILDLNFSQEGNQVIVQGDKKRISVSQFFKFKTKKVNFTVSVPSNFNIDLNTGGGGIDLRSIEGEVKGYTSGGGISAEEITGSLTVRTSGGGIELREINGPANARTSGGGITLEEINGLVEARTSGGGVQAYNLNGDASLHTSGGSITAEGHKGVLKARTSGGGIKITGLTGRAMAKTSGGSITFSLVEPPTGDCEMRTSAGSITCYLPRATNAHINARTSAGKVVTELPITVMGKIEKSSIEGTLGDGGPTLTMRTSAGSIKIKPVD
jgi:DUF4097 and DUF4098 domain-containing protein YvlB